MEGVQTLALNSREMRKPTPPVGPRKFKPDGSNLPAVVRWLQDNHAEKYRAWVEHVKTALPDLTGVKILERPEDRYLYLVLAYAQDTSVPAWLVSDGTLRMLALTLLAYLRSTDAVYLIEEPENGIHPQAVEAVLQSLSSAYESQVLVASHSPVLLGLVKQEQILCFSRTPEGATDIVLGSEHPALKEWRGETALSDLYAAGVLG
jgi:predicted ATPase